MSSTSLPFNIQANVPLNDKNTMGLPSVAAFYVSLQDEGLLSELVIWAQENNQKLFLLGGGSNVLPCEYVDGLVIQLAFKGIQSVSVEDDAVFVKASAGENWHDFVLYCHQHGWFGLENLAMIPGTVGAAPVQNIGAYGVELENVVESLTAFDLQEKTFVGFSKEGCKFAYRDSFFKSDMGKRYIITHVTFTLSPKPVINKTYHALNLWLVKNSIETPSPKDILDAVISIRSERLPSPEIIPNSGSFFKNPIVDSSVSQRLLATYPSMPMYSVAGKDKVKLAAGWLIDQAGWRGKRVSEICVHELQALVLTNPKRMGLNTLLDAEKTIKQDVLQKFGVLLEREPVILGVVNVADKPI